MPTQEPKTHPITIRVSAEMLNEIDSRTPDRRRACRERFVMDALEAYLGHPENVVYKPLPGATTDITQPEPKVTKAISEGTDKIKTGRYEV